MENSSTGNPEKKTIQSAQWLIYIYPEMKRIPLLQRLVTVLMALSLLTACSLPQVSAEERMFLDVSLDFLGEYPLSSTITGVEPPNLSGIAYQLPGYGLSDIPGIYFYGVSDDEDHSDGVKLYQLKLDLNRLTSDATEPSPLTVETVTVLKDQLGQPFQDATFQLESLAFTPRKSVFIAAEQIQDNQSVPLIGEFDLQTGQLKNTVPLPPNYRPQEEEEQPQGIQPDFCFRAMTIAPDGFSLAGLEPFRLFTTTATPLFQDLDAEATQLRLLHYVIADRASFLISENLYSLEPQSDTNSPYQLAGIVALPESGHFISLERSLTSSGDPGKLYQVFTGNATDTSRIASLRQPISIVEPLRKRLLLDLSELNLPPQRFDAMTLGPQLPDGYPSLILMSNDTEDTASAPQFLLFRIK